MLGSPDPTTDEIALRMPLAIAPVVKTRVVL
jgi:hypothetical protein